jgi:hypothetical protein
MGKIRAVCTRCRRRPSLRSNVQVWVADVFEWSPMLQEVLLCGFCRSEATAENAKALSRRTGPHWSIRL